MEGHSWYHEDSMMNLRLYGSMRLFSLALLALLVGCGGRQAPAADQTADPTPETQAGTDESAAAETTNELPLIEGMPRARVAHGYLIGGAMTPEHVAEAKEKGYTRIIDVRTEGEKGVAEERAKAEEVTIEYVSFPISGPEDLTEEKVQAFDELLARDAGPTIVHCASANRVGALFALRAYYIDKKPAEEALQIGLDAGLTKLEAYVREKLGL